MRINKPKSILLILSTTLALNAHACTWGWLGTSAGDDGNPNTVGNAAAQQSKSAPAKALVKNAFNLNLVNNS